VRVAYGGVPDLGTEREDGGRFLRRRRRARHEGPASPSGPLRLHQFFEQSVDAGPDAVALECQGAVVTYADLDRRANRLANHLLATGLEPGSRVGLLLHRSVDMYVALLASLKAAATFVPIDPAAPADRVAYIAEDSALDVVLTQAALLPSCEAVQSRVLAVDDAAGVIAKASSGRPQIEPQGDPTCYIIYTSGSTGRPKGVEVAQSSICNFVAIVPEIYGVTPSDRVYQGMTIAFDFSIEEIWPTWAVGATLVAGPTDGRRVGTGLADFLESSSITMIYCVPTVLATLDRTIPSIRTVNVGGEACPQELVERWGGAGRRILNTYGPTEATVTCTWAELVPGKPVTIGRPLPTYSITILDEDQRPVPAGAVGEISVGGPGVARGYVNRPDLTADRFILDPSGHDGERIYRTGDLGRFLPDGEIEYLGRADAEVKVRGHRVDLGEIESVLLEDDDVSAAVVTLLKTPGTGGELAGYVTLARIPPRDGNLVGRLHTALRRRLPSYMVPSYLQVIDTIPMLPSGKADRTRLPEPTGARLIGADRPYVAPETETERRLAALWEESLRLERGSVSVDADLFEDLGGHSLVAATLVSRLRADSEQGQSGLSILDLYANPTIRSLAQLVDERALDQAASSSETQASSGAPRRSKPPRWWRVATFGIAQLGWLYALLVVLMLPIGIVYHLNAG